MTRAILLVDKFSLKGNAGKFKQYGSKGETVEIISWHDNVAIVKGKSGTFSIKKEDLKQQKK